MFMSQGVNVCSSERDVSRAGCLMDLGFRV